MTEKTPAVERREQRQAQALRENLKRRKAQARRRAEAAQDAGDQRQTGLSPQSDGDLSK